ncbi:MAG TPA: DHA2 family efflux MFS transporter permease subunit [Gemmatimonadaceae bacterium]|nr:DHA2 family efflux MFS transporter permease subunit [Gemmatimonadaceae bacterium]
MASSAANAAQQSYTEDVEQYRWIILAGLITAAVMEVLDTTIINVALPQMAGNLGATMQEIAWVSTGYILSNVVVLPMTAFFTATFGRKNYLTASIILFVCASFMCGTSHSLGELVLWRVVQGAGGAALLSTAQATIRQIFPREQQGMVQAIFILGIIVAPTLGPTLGGWITDNYNWNWCFFINVPIGIVSAFLVSGFLHDPPHQARRSGPVDWLGIGLLIVGLASLQYVLEQGREKDWFSDPLIVRLSIISAICLSTMLWWEMSKRNTHPIVNFRVLHNRDLAGSIFLFIALGFGLYGGTFLFPLFTQNLLHFTPTETGLTLMPGGIATACIAMVCGKLLNGARPMVDARLLIYIGLATFVVSMWQLGHLTTAAGEVDARWPLIVRGIALGFLFTPINNVAYANLEPHEAQQASGLINLSRQLGGSFGIAIMTTYLDHQISFHRSELVAHTVPANPLLVQRTQAVTAGLMAHGYTAYQAQQGAIAVLDRTVMGQAMMLAYNDTWLLILKTFIVVAPAILVIRKPRGHAGPGEMH